MRWSGWGGRHGDALRYVAFASSRSERSESGAPSYRGRLIRDRVRGPRRPFPRETAHLLTTTVRSVVARVALEFRDRERGASPALRAPEVMVRGRAVRRLRGGGRFGHRAHLREGASN